jgi:hypothetical protein
MEMFPLGRPRRRLEDIYHKTNVGELVSEDSKWMQLAVSCSIPGFDLSNVETSSSATAVLISQ